MYAKLLARQQWDASSVVQAQDFLDNCQRVEKLGGNNEQRSDLQIIRLALDPGAAPGSLCTSSTDPAADGNLSGVTGGDAARSCTN
jgi:hypothetical protein